MPGENVKWVVEDYIYIEKELPDLTFKAEVILELMKLAYELHEERVIVERYEKGEVDHDQPNGE